MNYEEKYKEALEKAKRLYGEGTITECLCHIFPELRESEDERIRKWLEELIEAMPDNSIEFNDVKRIDVLHWLEEQETSYTKRDVEDAYIEGMAFAKNELEKQGRITKLSEEEQNTFSKGVLTSCAFSFIDYLDAHKYEGKMCVSNGECEDIENAFHNAMWDRLHRYYCKYIEKQGEPTLKAEPSGMKTLNTWSEEDENVLNNLIAFLKVEDELQYDWKQIIIWLESLKERIGG